MSTAAVTAETERDGFVHSDSNYVQLFAGLTRIPGGRIELMLLPEAGAQASDGSRTLVIPPRSATLVFPVTQFRIREHPEPKVLGAAIDVDVFAHLLDLGFGGSGTNATLNALQHAVFAEGRTYWSIPLSEAAFWGLVSLCKIEQSRLQTRWEALQFLTSMLRHLGPAVKRSFPDLGQGAVVSKEQRLVQKAQKILETEYSRGLTVPELANRLNVSPSTLNRAFRRELGASVKDQLASIRLTRFEQLLRETSVSVTEASRLVGFRSSSQIREKFREIHGVPASEWRSAAP
ncbi:MAG: helix-turn-helix transcriptional regulator [Agromyces sp.]